jgi:hypothetical protein
MELTKKEQHLIKHIVDSRHYTGLNNHILLYSLFESIDFGSYDIAGALYSLELKGVLKTTNSTLVLLQIPEVTNQQLSIFPIL